MNTTHQAFALDEQLLQEPLHFQDYILQYVSRTFALTIPQLPRHLSHVVGNAYLLCRITDTIEDDPDLSFEAKDHFLHEFRRVVWQEQDPQAFATQFGQVLSPKMSEAEKELIEKTATVLKITYAMPEREYQAVATCVEKMAKGMPQFQRHSSLKGVATLQDMDAYCYYVAGVVGEMLTELFCAYSPHINHHATQLMKLAPSFGQGLQMTNILKDIWDDHKRQVSWLPQEIFAKHGFALETLTTSYDPKFGEGLQELIGVAHAHLQNAFDYILLIPRSETGIRQFCLWALGLAVQTLQNIHQHPQFTSGQQVKVPRDFVKKTILMTKLISRSNLALTWWFKSLEKGLPVTPLDTAWTPIALNN